MSIDSTVYALVEEFKTSGRIVIVGASLAGLRAAEALREEGFRGQLTIVGDEPYEPYDRPPLSKQVLKGQVPADHTELPRRRVIDAEWRLGVAATGLDRAAKQVRLANGEQVRYDLLLIATGVRARPWFNPAEAALDGVFAIRTRDDAARLRERLAAGPRRVNISPSACRPSATRSPSRRARSRSAASPPPTVAGAASSPPSPSITASGWSTTPG
jgi:NADPH-dependent 2,4-dienoyl-CoA reductase/sulfur reductase-like enzyme